MPFVHIVQSSKCNWKLFRENNYDEVSDFKVLLIRPKQTIVAYSIKIFPLSITEIKFLRSRKQPYWKLQSKQT